jgi:S1-C subfamily serine protease
MDENRMAHSDEPPAGQDAPAGSPAAVTDSGEAAELSGTGSRPESGQDATPAGPRRTGPARVARIAAYLGAAVLMLGVGFGLTKLVEPPRAASLSSDIPTPAKSGGVFTEDDDGTGQDSESNIFASTVPGLVHVISAGKAVGIGLVLTPSGKVLTTYQPSGGAAGLSAKYVLSGKTFRATVLGTDPSTGLALLQMQGGHGHAFSTATVGNSDTLVASTYASKQLSYHIPGEVFDTAVGTSGTKDAVIIDTGLLTALNWTVTVDGKTRTGLMQSRLQSVSAGEIGGPLVNLAGQVIGITVADGGTGLAISGYAMPINRALAIARQIDAKA